MQAQARARAVGVLLLVAAVAACGEDPTVSVADQVSPTPTAVPAQSPTSTPSPVGGSSGGAAEQPTDEPTDEPTQVEAPTGSEPDLDGDGRADSVSLVEVPGMGWSFDVRLADGRETSAPLPDDEVVHHDVEVVGAVDLDRDGADEVLVRTLRAVGGENAVVFRLDGNGVWLVRTAEGVPWELSTSGGMTGPRSWDCADGAVRTRESSRQDDGTYAATTRTWVLRGHAVELRGEEAAVTDAEQVALDPSTCGP